MLPLVDSRDRILSVLHVIVQQVLLAGIERVGIIISPGQQDILRQYFTAVKDQGWGNLSDAIEYIIQPSPKGFGDAVLSGLDFVENQPFVLLLGDHVHIHESDAPCCTEQVIQAFTSQRGSAMVGVQCVHEDELSKVGVTGGDLISKNTYKCRRFVEKPACSVARDCLVTKGLPAGSFLAHCGIYVFSSEIFDCLRQVEIEVQGSGSEVELAAAQTLLLARHPEQYFLNRIKGRAYDVGTPAGYTEAQVAFRKQSCAAPRLNERLYGSG